MIDLTQEAHIVVTEQQSRDDAEGITLRVESPSDPVLGHCDPNAVHRILTNLVSNSLMFTDAGGEVTVRAFVNDDRACLTVEDTGVGMSDSFQEEMFEAIVQDFEATQRSYEGGGLGLAIVKHLVETHDGSLDIDSSRGEGSTITVRLPAAP